MHYTMRAVIESALNFRLIDEPQPWMDLPNKVIRLKQNFQSLSQTV